MNRGVSAACSLGFTAALQPLFQLELPDEGRRVGAQREAKLRVMQFSRRSALDAKPVERKLSRKDLLDEIATW